MTSETPEIARLQIALAAAKDEAKLWKFRAKCNGQTVKHYKDLCSKLANEIEEMERTK